MKGKEEKIMGNSINSPDQCIPKNNRSHEGSLDETGNHVAYWNMV